MSAVHCFVCCTYCSLSQDSESPFFLLFLLRLPCLCVIFTSFSPPHLHPQQNCDLDANGDEHTLEESR